jgi:hypothetical protein
MNEPDPSAASTGLIRPLSLVLGLAVGLAVLSWKGREVGDYDWHPNFTRFHPMISPEAQYEPSVAEMEAIVRARCRPDQVLVIVGGNSVLLGVGQPADKMWTLQLQSDLGDGYAVVNLAFRGAAPNDAGAIVAEALRKEFPRQIYIANEIPFQSSIPIGIETYRFVLFDAYYKGLLLPWEPRDRVLSASLWTTNYRQFHQKDLQLGAKLDRWLYFHNFWNWISYNKHFTFATDRLPHAPEAFWPRSRFEDRENDFDSMPFESRFTPQVVAADLNIARQFTASFYHQNEDKSWTLNKDALKVFLRTSREAFPDQVKPRTLLLIGRNDPYYTRQLEPDIGARDDLAIREAISALESLGYGALEYGRDFEVADYGDRVHLTSSGGVKLAATVAPKVQDMARKLRYLPP